MFFVVSIIILDNSLRDILKCLRIGKDALMLCIFFICLCKTSAVSSLFQPHQFPLFVVPKETAKHPRKEDIVNFRNGRMSEILTFFLNQKYFVLTKNKLCLKIHSLIICIPS